MTERRFPIQGHTEKERDPKTRAIIRVPPMTVPWIVGEIAYNDYARRFGRGQSLERLAERAGFCQGEMDDHFPQWRELTEILDGPSGEQMGQEGERIEVWIRPDELDDLKSDTNGISVVEIREDEDDNGGDLKAVLLILGTPTKGDGE